MPDFIVSSAAGNAVTALDLRNFIDIKELQRVQDDFATSTGLTVIIIDSMGRPIAETSRFNILCQYLCCDPTIHAECYSCGAYGGLQSATRGRLVVYRCHAGLVNSFIPIMWGAQYLSAVMVGQVLLIEGQQQLQQTVSASEALEHPEAAKLLDQMTVTGLGKLQTAANEIVGLVNARLGSMFNEVDFTVTVAGAVLGRLGRIPDPSSNTTLIPLPAGIRKLLPLIPVESAKRRISLEAPVVVRNVMQDNATANSELLGDYLDHPLPRQSQKANPKELSEYEDMMIGVAANEAVQFGRDISQIVTRHRGHRHGPTNRYKCQVYCGKLLIRVHDLLEPASRGGGRNLTALLNEVEKSPSSFLMLHRMVFYLMWSGSYFTRKFKERTGLNFIHYATAKQLERAKLVFIHTDKPAFRIVAELNLTPLNYFSRQLKKHIGVTPSGYRKEHSRRAAWPGLARRYTSCVG